MLRERRAWSMVDQGDAVVASGGTVVQRISGLSLAQSFDIHVCGGAKDVTAQWSTTHSRVSLLGSITAIHHQRSVNLVRNRAKRCAKVGIADCGPADIGHGAWNAVHLDRAQPKRVAEVDRIATGEAVQVQPAGQANRVFLRVTPDRRTLLRPDARKPLPLFSLAAEPLQMLIVIWGSKPRCALRGGSGARFSQPRACARAGDRRAGAQACGR